MYHACLAKEQTDTSCLKYLNYASGPLETTDMTMQLRSEPELDCGLKSFFQNNKLIDPIDSAHVLVRLVLEDAFNSGQHIDYYDIVPISRPQHASSSNKDMKE
jgi:hypothetical protein